MTKSDFIKKRIEPLIRVLKPFLPPEDDPKLFEIKLEIWVHRLLIDVQSFDPASYEEGDIPYTPEEF